MKIEENLEKLKDNNGNVVELEEVNLDIENENEIETEKIRD